MILAARLEDHPEVIRVRYPGLASHPTHEIAKRVLKGFGTIISFDLRGDAAFADRVCQQVKLIRHATSLGAVESTIERRAAIPGRAPSPLRWAALRQTSSMRAVTVSVDHPSSL